MVQYCTCVKVPRKVLWHSHKTRNRAWPSGYALLFTFKPFPMELLFKELIRQADQKETIAEFKEKMLDFFELWLFRVEFDPDQF